ITLTQVTEQMTSLTSMCELSCQIVQKKLEEKKLEEEQAAKAQNWKLLVCYDDDDDEERSNSLKDNIISELPPCAAITPNDPVDSLKSMLNHDYSIIISLKNDSLFDEFAGELTLLKSISPGIDETDCDHENEIPLVERLLYDNSSPRPSEEFVYDSSDAFIESFSPSPILVKDSDSFMEEIDLSFNPDDPMSPGIEEDDDGSERDILIHEELLDNYSLSIHENESYHFDIPSSS
nr:hypothetical protein [Tanacetum cinerariifolium]